MYTCEHTHTYTHTHGAGSSIYLSQDDLFISAASLFGTKVLETACRIIANMRMLPSPYNMTFIRLPSYRSADSSLWYRDPISLECCGRLPLADVKQCLQPFKLQCVFTYYFISFVHYSLQL